MNPNRLLDKPLKKEGILVLFSFTIKKPNDIATTFKKVKAYAEKYKATFEGTETAGEVLFNGVKGNYAIENDVIRINILKKKLPIPNRIIENEIRALFKEATK